MWQVGNFWRWSTSGKTVTLPSNQIIKSPVHLCPQLYNTCPSSVHFGLLPERKWLWLIELCKLARSVRWLRARRPGFSAWQRMGFSLSDYAQTGSGAHVQWIPWAHCFHQRNRWVCSWFDKHFKLTSWRLTGGPRVVTTGPAIWVDSSKLKAALTAPSFYYLCFVIQATTVVVCDLRFSYLSSLTVHIPTTGTAWGVGG